MKENPAAKDTTKHEIVDLGSGESDEGENSQGPEAIICRSGSKAFRDKMTLTLTVTDIL